MWRNFHAKNLWHSRAEEAQLVVLTSQSLQNEGEPVIVSRLAQDVVPALRTTPQGLSQDQDELWSQFVPPMAEPGMIILMPAIAAPKPDAGFGISSEALTGLQQ